MAKRKQTWKPAAALAEKKPAEPTRLWLVTILVEMPDHMSLTAVRLQRVMVAPLVWNKSRVKVVATHYADDVYADHEVTVKVESVLQIKDLEDLAKNLITLTSDQKILKGVPEAALPTELHIEMAYDDVSGDQQTPSRLESLVYPCRVLADEAQALLGQMRPDNWQINCWPGGSPSDYTDKPSVAIDFATGMLQEHYGDDEEDDDGQTQEVSEENP